MDIHIFCCSNPPFNESKLLKIIEEAGNEIASLRARVVLDWGEPGVMPKEDNFVWVRHQRMKPWPCHLITIRDGTRYLWYCGQDFEISEYLASQPDVQFSVIPMPREKE